MCIYLVIYRFPFFLYIFIELNRLIDPSVYPLRCTHGTSRCSTRGRPKWMHLPRPSGWEKSRRPMVWCIRRWQNARFRKCWKLGGCTVLPAFSILSDIFSHSWYPMVIPCYPMVIFSVEKNNLSQLSHVTPWFGWWSSMKILGRLRGEENCVTTGYSEGAKEEVRRTGCWLLFYCRPLDGSWYVLLLVKKW